MGSTVDSHILELNFLEFLTNFLEGKVELAMVLQVNERIYQRDHTSLSEELLAVSTRLHDLKEKQEIIDNETISEIVNDSVIKLTKPIKAR